MYTLSEMEIITINTTVTRDAIFAKNLGYNIYMASLFGSQNYWVSTLESDIDTKIIVIPGFQDLLKGHMAGITYERNYYSPKGQITIIPLNNFFHGLKNGNPVALEVLGSYYNVKYAKLKFTSLLTENYYDLPLIDTYNTLTCIYGQIKSYFKTGLNNRDNSKGKKMLANIYRLNCLMERWFTPGYFEDHTIEGVFIPRAEERENIYRLKELELKKDFFKLLNEEKNKADKNFERFKMLEHSKNLELQRRIDELYKRIVADNIKDEIKEVLKDE